MLLFRIMDAQGRRAWQRFPVDDRIRGQRGVRHGCAPDRGGDDRVRARTRPPWAPTTRRTRPRSDRLLPTVWPYASLSRAALRRRPAGPLRSLVVVPYHPAPPVRCRFQARLPSLARAGVVGPGSVSPRDHIGLIGDAVRAAPDAWTPAFRTSIVEDPAPVLPHPDHHSRSRTARGAHSWCSPTRVDRTGGPNRFA
jgi:hypothetical protein